MAEYVTEEDFDQFTAAVTSALEQVNYHLQMLVWAQNGTKGPRPARPVVYNINAVNTDEALRELNKRQQPGGAGAA